MRGYWDSLPHIPHKSELISTAITQLKHQAKVCFVREFLRELLREYELAVHSYSRVFSTWVSMVCRNHDFRTSKRSPVLRKDFHILWGECTKNFIKKAAEKSGWDLLHTRHVRSDTGSLPERRFDPWLRRGSSDTPIEKQHLSQEKVMASASDLASSVRFCQRISM